METPEYDNEGRLIIVSPSVEVETLRGPVLLHWGNTKVRLFPDKYDYLNHIEYRDDEGDLCGIAASLQFMTELMDNNFPYEYSPVPDPNTEEWYIDRQMRLFESAE